MEEVGRIVNEAGGVVCHMFTSTADQRAHAFRNHKHTALELSLIISGEGIYQTASGLVPIAAGDIFLFSTNEFHCITDVFTPTMQLLNLHIQPSFVWNVGNGISDNGYMNVFFHRKEGFCNRLTADALIRRQTADLLLAIRREFEEGLPDFACAVKTLLLQALILLHRKGDLSEMTKGEAVAPEQMEAVRLAMNYMDKHFTQAITLEEIAGVSYLSKSYFCTLFKKLNGLTPWEYINIKRIHRAVELLKSTPQSVLSIAMQCGYHNTANFNKIFRSVTGQTPKAYRKKSPQQAGDPL